jgi:hypothetical protein
MKLMTLPFQFLFVERSPLQMIDEKTYAFSLIFFDEREDSDYWIKIGSIDVVIDIFGNSSFDSAWETEEYHEEIANYQKKHPSSELLSLMENETSGKIFVLDAKKIIRELAHINRFTTFEIKNITYKQSHRDYIEFGLKGTGLTFTLYLPSENYPEETLQVNGETSTFDISLITYGLRDWEEIREQIMKHPDIRLKVLGR